METFYVRQGDELEIAYSSCFNTTFADIICIQIREVDKVSARLALDNADIRWFRNKDSGQPLILNACANFIFQATGPAFAVKVVDGLKVSSPIKERETWLSKERYGYPSAVKLVHVATYTTVVITCVGCQNKTMRLDLVFPDKIIRVGHQRGDSWTADELTIRSILEEMRTRK